MMLLPSSQKYLSAFLASAMDISHPNANAILIVLIAQTLSREQLS